MRSLQCARSAAVSHWPSICALRVVGTNITGVNSQNYTYKNPVKQSASLRLLPAEAGSLHNCGRLNHPSSDFFSSFQATTTTNQKLLSSAECHTFCTLPPRLCCLCPLSIFRQHKCSLSEAMMGAGSWASRPQRKSNVLSNSPAVSCLYFCF